MKLRLPHPQSLFLLTVVLVLLALGLQFGLPIYRQQMAIREIERLGGAVQARLKAPLWLRERLPDEFVRLFGTVRLVHLRTTAVTDADLSILRTFPQLEALSLSYSGVTDAGLTQLSGFEHLRILELDKTAVTDAGLEGLSRLPRLRSLSAVCSGTTWKSRKRLRESNPAIQVWLGTRDMGFETDD
jgi:hypothetical protein